MRSMHTLRTTLSYAALAGLFAAYVSLTKLLPVPRTQTDADRLRVVLPDTVQTILSGGDRHLAANIGLFRAVTLTTSTVDAGTVATLARIQQSAARLNPYSADNFYIAEAILPWQGHTEETNDILNRTSKARSHDFMPPFFLAFNYYHFAQNPIEAATILETQALPRAPAANQLAMHAMMSKWREQHSDPRAARELLQAMSAGSRDPRLKHLIQARIIRLDGLIALREAATRFRKAHLRPPQTLEELVTTGMIDKLPADPLRVGYNLDPNGTPQLIYKY